MTCTKCSFGLLMMLTAILLSMADASCQRIGFRILSGNSKITVTPLFPVNLQFDHLVMDSGAVSEIELGGRNDERVVVVAVDVPEYGDLQVTATSTYADRLYHVAEKNSHIPFQLNMAYSNNGYTVNHTDIRSAKAQSIQAAKGLNSIIFSVNSSSSQSFNSAPLFEDEGNMQSKTRVYLFFYGSIGPVTSSSRVVAGIYETDIMVNIEYIADAED